MRENMFSRKFDEVTATVIMIKIWKKDHFL